MPARAPPPAGSGPDADADQRALSVAIDAGRAFERYVWANPEVCNECFRRCKADEQPPERAPAVAAPVADRAGYDGELATAPEDHDAYGAITTHAPRTTCTGCGSVRLLAQSDTLDRRSALRRADRLADRLDEQAIPVSRRALRRAVRKLKARDDLQGYDREIFAAAVKLAIEWAGRL